MAGKQKKQAADVEWLGGIESMPAYVDDVVEPFRPEVLVWMSADGLIVGTETGKPGTLLDGAVDHLRATMAAPLFGPPQTPTRIRVASPDLANALRAGCAPAITVTLAPTPELDAIVLSLRDHLGEASGEESYLGGDVNADAMAAFFRAAAGLHRVAPWSVMPGDSPLSFSIPGLGVSDGAFTVMGQQGEHYGVVLFESIEEYIAFIDAADVMEAGQEPKLPRQMAIQFIPEGELPPAMVEEVASHRWEIPDASAYPELMVVDEDLVGRGPTAAELKVAEALALALTRLVAEKRVLRAALDGGDPIERTFSVPARGGELDVTLRAPHPGAPPVLLLTTADILIELEALDEEADDGELDTDRCLEVNQEIESLFAMSVEAKGLDVRWSGLVLDLAALHLGRTVRSLDADDVSEVLFEIFPRKVTVEATVASAVINECRAFFAYAKRELGMSNADDCIAVLDDDAAEELESALSEPSAFGSAKAVAMAAVAAGVDPTNPQALQAWITRHHGMPLGGAFLGPSISTARPLDKAAAKAKKSKRKATRKARKKGR